MEARRGLRRVGILLLILLVTLAYCFAVPRMSRLGGTASVLGILGLLIVFKAAMSGLETRGVKVKKEEKRAARGAKAEEDMGVLLASLPEGYVVLNDVEIGYGNIDHVILSRSKGLFVVETKSHHGNVSAERGRLLLNGHAAEKDFIAQTMRNCLTLKQWVKENLQTNAWVTGAVVFTNAFVELRQPLQGVHVINKGYLLKFLERQRDNPDAARIWELRDRLRSLLEKQPSPAAR